MSSTAVLVVPRWCLGGASESVAYTTTRRSAQQREHVRELVGLISERLDERGDLGVGLGGLRGGAAVEADRQRDGPALRWGRRGRAGEVGGLLLAFPGVDERRCRQCASGCPR